MTDTEPERPAPGAAARAARVVRRLARPVVRRLRAAAGPTPVLTPAKDSYAAFRSLDGPELVATPAVRHDPDLDGRGRLVVLLPHLDVAKMSGGPNTVFQLTARLVPLGVPVRYVATTGALAPDREALAAHVERLTGRPLPPDAVDFVEASAPGAAIEVGRDDVLLATWWPTAWAAQSALGHVRAREFVYVVQDYEPGFYPWSTRHALAEATYGMSIRAIVNEPLLQAYLAERRVGRFAEPGWPCRTFLPAVDRSVFARLDRDPGQPRRLVFYARPRNPRNLFELGLRVLRQAAAEGVFDGEPWELVSIGGHLPDLELTPRHRLRAEPWLSYEAYGRLLGSSDVLLSLMLSPHTSYPPLEMAAAGGLVVTNTFGPKTAEALAAISPSVRAAPPDVDALVATLRAAVEELAGGGPPAAASDRLALPATWDEALADVVPWLADQVAELRGG